MAEPAAALAGMLAPEQREEIIGNAEIRDAVYYQMALLRMRAGQFPLAAEPLSALARVKSETPALVAACGLFLLQMAVLPGDIPEGKRDLVQMAGRAAFSALGLKTEAKARFEELLMERQREA